MNDVRKIQRELISVGRGRPEPMPNPDTAAAVLIEENESGRDEVRGFPCPLALVATWPGSELAIDELQAESGILVMRGDVFDLRENSEFGLS